MCSFDLFVARSLISVGLPGQIKVDKKKKIEMSVDSISQPDAFNVTRD